MKSTPKTLPYRLRPELRWNPIQQSDGPMWIASDPWNKEMHRCSEEDYAIFRWLAQAQTIESIQLQFRQSFRPKSIETAQVYSLLQRGHELGILRKLPLDPSATRLPEATAGIPQVSTTRPASVRFATRIASKIVRVLQVRIPIGDPSRWLRKLEGFASLLFSNAGFSALLLFAMLAVGVVVTRWQQAISEVPSWSHLRSPAVWIGYGVIFFLTRGIHELGHGLAAIRNQIRPREFGLVGNLGMLCPYVDITESWRCERSAQRIMIASGGVLAEAWIASIAAMAWAFTHEGILHDIAFQTMVICSVTTAMFNANPLLKYDGYFVLCDLLGVQNLRERAWKAFDSLWSHRWADSGIETLFLSGYFLLSLLNRGLLIFGISTIAYSIAMEWRLAGVGILVGALYGACVMLLWCSQRPIPSRSSTGHLNRRTHLLGWTAVALLICFALTMPIPQRIYSTGDLRTGEMHPLYASESGTLRLPNDSLIDSEVIGDQLLFEVQNDELEKELLAASSKSLHAKHQLDSLRRRAFFDSQSLEQIPIAETQLAVALSSMKDLQDRKESQATRAPQSGRFRIAESSDSEMGSSVRSPFLHEVRNREIGSYCDGEHVSKGTLVGWLVEKESASAECLLSDSAYANVRIGMRANVRSMRFPNRLLQGRVVEISNATRQSSDGIDARKNSLATPIQLRIELDENDWIAQQSVALHDSKAEIVFLADNRSLLSDWSDAFLRNFRVR